MYKVISKAGTKVKIIANQCVFIQQPVRYGLLESYKYNRHSVNLYLDLWLITGFWNDKLRFRHVTYGKIGSLWLLGLQLRFDNAIWLILHILWVIGQLQNNYIVFHYLTKNIYGNCMCFRDPLSAYSCHMTLLYGTFPVLIYRCV